MMECVGQRGLVEWTSSEWLFVFLEIKRDRFIAKETMVTSKRNQIGPRKASRTSIGQSGGKDKKYVLRSGFYLVRCSVTRAVSMRCNNCGTRHVVKELDVVQRNE